MAGKKTISQAFRFDAKTHEILVEEARNQRVSLNVLVGHVLEDYAKWGIMVDRVKVLSFGPPVIATIFRECPEDVVRKIGTELGEKHPIEMLASDGVPFNLDSVKVLIEIWLSRYAHWYEPLQINMKSETWQIHLIHGISRKWSLFLCEYMTAMFNTLGAQLEARTLQDYSTTLVFKVPNKREGPL